MFFNAGDCGLVLVNATKNVILFTICKHWFLPPSLNFKSTLGLNRFVILEPKKVV